MEFSPLALAVLDFSIRAPIILYGGELSTAGAGVHISHKTQAALQFLLPTTVIYIAFGAFLINGNWPGWADLKENSPAFAITGIVAMLVQDLIPKPFKEFLVFWRKTDRLPGHRAFSEIVFDNPNIDVASVSNIERLKNCNAQEQQREFYQRYNRVRDHPSVSHLSQRYIAWRDTSALLFMLFCISIPVIAAIDRSRVFSVGVILCSMSALFCVLTGLAARNSATTLTVRVLSLEPSKENSNV